MATATATDAKLAKQSPVDSLANQVSRMKGAIEQVLPKHLTADRMLRVAIMAVRTTPHLSECSSASVIASLMACSMLGLEPNSPLKQAYLIPYWSTKLGGYECQLIIDYRGKIDLARRSGEIASVQAHAVYEGDDWDYGLGLEPFLKHKPSGKAGREDPKKLTYVYCVVKLKEQGTEPIFVVLSRDQIEARRLRGASGRKGRDGKPISTPWDTDYEKMAKKTAVHECMTWAPRSAEMAMADEIEARLEDGKSIIPTLPESVTAAMLENGIAEQDVGTVVEIESESAHEPAPAPAPPEADGKRVHVGKPAKQEPAAKQPSTPPPAKSDPANTTPGITPEQIKTMKREAKEGGDAELVALCEQGLLGDFEALAKLQDIRNAGTQM